jgi:hypothetical protein
LSLAACAAPTASPQAIQRLDPAELAAIDAARAARPLSLDDIVRKSRAGVGTAALLDEIRRTGTRHALTPPELQRLREQGVAREVLDELADAEARALRDQAAADKVRRATEQAAAEDRARADAERRRRAYPPYYYDPYGRPFGYPAYPYGYPGAFGGGVLIRR